MKLTKDTKFTRFETECFYVDIVEKKGMFEAWLQEKNYGVAALMFGIPKEQTVNKETVSVDFDFFCELVEVQLDEYIFDYYAEYCN